MTLNISTGLRSRRATWFFDMDGVIARYDRYAYDRNNGPEPGVALFEHEKSHYFRHCEPDANALALLKIIAGSMPGNGVYILTAVAQHIPWAALDKRLWLEEHCPYIDANTQLIVTNSDKAEIAKAMTTAGKLDTTTILIDDYNPNLIKWQAAGGQAVKYINGVNSPESWAGEIIDGRVPAPEI